MVFVAAVAGDAALVVALDVEPVEISPKGRQDQIEIALANAYGGRMRDRREAGQVVDVVPSVSAWLDVAVSWLAAVTDEVQRSPHRAKGRVAAAGSSRARASRGRRAS